MAKNSRYVGSRLATTVNARYYPDEKVIDAYYLDGRFTGKRENRAADNTYDREDRGFLFALFAYPAEEGVAPGETSFADTVRQLNQEVKSGEQSIDTQINDLADLAIDVGGKATLPQEGVRQSYFSGIIVKEGEIAAVTTAEGCAFLYRGNVLYPLTSGDFELEAIDLNGNPVQHLFDYSAGVAGTIRYSNLAQIQEDDCLILCNNSLLNILGQREILRILDEAQDQEEAASSLVTAAAAKQTGLSLQVMISLVDYVETMVDSDDREISAAPKAPRQERPFIQGDPHDPYVNSQATQRYIPVTDEDLNQYYQQDAPAADREFEQYAAETAAVAGTATADRTFDDEYAYAYDSYNVEDDFSYREPESFSDDYRRGADYAAGQEYVSSDGFADDREDNWQYDEHLSSPDQDYAYDDGGYDDSAFVHGGDPYYTQSGHPQYDEYGEYGDEAYGDYYDDQYSGYDEYQDTQAGYYDDGYDSQYGDQGYYDDGYQDQYYDEYQQNYYDEYEDYYEDDRSDKIKRIAFYSILLVIVAVCIFILVRLLSGGKETETTRESESESATIERTTEKETEKPTESKTEKATEPDSTEDSEEPTSSDAQSGGTQAPQTYVVKFGDSFYGIIISYYEAYNDEIIQAVLDMNPHITNIDSISEGMEIILPDIN